MSSIPSKRTACLPLNVKIEAVRQVMSPTVSVASVTTRFPSVKKPSTVSLNPAEAVVAHSPRISFLPR